MAPLPPFCSVTKSNGEHRKHKDPNLPCLYCGLDPASFEDSDEDDCVETEDPDAIARLSTTSSKSAIPLPLPPTSTAPNSFRFAPVSRRTTATSMAPLRQDATRIALAQREESNIRARGRVKDHAGHPPPGMSTTSGSLLAVPKKQRPTAITQQDVFHFICVGIIEQAFYKNAFQKENDIPYVASRTVACMLPTAFYGRS